MFTIKTQGGQMVAKGNYWNLSTGERVTLETRGTLPGDHTATYYRLSPLVLLVLGPLFGLVYAIFLPFIGMFLLLKISIQKTGDWLTHQAHKGAIISWRPHLVPLTGKRTRFKSR